MFFETLTSPRPNDYTRKAGASHRTKYVVFIHAMIELRMRWSRVWGIQALFDRPGRDLRARRKL
jgi:hypothetical protein